MRSRYRDPSAIGQEWSARQATMLVVALLVAMVFGPVTARAAGTLVSIVDPSTGAKAHVSSGKLEVGDGDGALTINGNVKATFPQPQPIAGTVNVQNTAEAPLHVSVENTAGAPVPINGAVTVTDTLNARQALPESPWHSLVQGNNSLTLNMFGPAQSPTQVAVTSFTIVNGGDVKGTVAVQISPSAGGVCQSAGGTEITEFTVAGNDTGQFEYPEPLVVSLNAGTCLTVQITGTGATKVTGVGFTQ
jgi:hypothetical protein